MNIFRSARRSPALSLIVLLAACASPEPRDEAPRNALVAPAPGAQRAPTTIGPGIDGRAAQSVLRTPAARYVLNADPALVASLKNPFPPTPKKQREKYRYVGPGGDGSRAAADPTRATRGTIESIDTQTNIDNTGGFLFIPADAHGAAGPNHVVAVTNVSIEFFQKNGTLDLSTSLQTFFSPLSPANFTFDPKVLYDQYEDRWLVVTLERTDTGSGDASNTSSILLAVSDDSDPNGTWSMIRIDASETISGDDHWFDYPGFAVDDEAVYVTGNMFQFFGGTGNPGQFGGTRLFIVDKGTLGGFYDGGTASAARFDPAGGAGAIATTMQPAHTYGAAPGSIGSWLTAWSGIANTVTGADTYQIIEVSDPLGTPVFTVNYLEFGNVDDGAVALPAAPQAGVSTDDMDNVGIATNDRRTLDAVWRDDGLWVSHSYLPNSGADSGQVTAAWARIDTTDTSALALDQFGFIGGEDIVGGAYTYFPSLAVNADGGLMVGFSASAATINAGSYYAYRTPTDPPGTIRDSVLIRAGTDYYERTFGGPDNRWGDYSSAVVDPDGECFWIYNKYAIARGTRTGNDDDGRWGSAFAQFCNDPPVAAGDAAAVTAGGTVTELTGGATTLIANDDDPDASDLLTVTTAPVSGPDHAASFALNDDGTFSYTHDGTANLSDAFVYEVCDDGSPIQCDTATVDITISENVPPTPGDDTATVPEGGTVSIVNGGDASVLANDTDPDSDNLAVTTTPVSAPAHAASFTLDASGTFAYTHDGSETTSDSFVYEVCDDGTPSFCADATVSITVTEVNDPPNAVGETLVDVAEDAGVRAYAFSGLLANDDPGAGETGQSLTITAVSNPVGGTVAIDGTNVEFTPASDYNGPAAFEYTVTDDGTTDGAADPRSAVATASFTITEVNDAPNATGETLPDVAEDAGVQAIAFSALLANDDPGPGESGQSITITAVSSPVGGTVAIDGTDVRFTPAPDYDGAAGFEYSVTDDGTTDGSADPRTSAATASFTITEVNDAPVAVDDDLGDVSEGLSPVVFEFDDLVANDLPGGNETGQTLTIVDVGDPVGGDVAIVSGTVEFEPETGFTGTASFDYAVEDDGTTAGLSDPKQDVATASFGIVALNSPPNAVDDSFVIAIDQALAADAGFNDSDPDADSLTFSVAAPPSNGTLTFDSDGTFTYQPDAGYSGDDAFSYSVSDGTTSREATVRIRIVDLVFEDGFETTGVIAP